MSGPKLFTEAKHNSLT